MSLPCTFTTTPQISSPVKPLRMAERDLDAERGRPSRRPLGYRVKCATRRSEQTRFSAETAPAFGQDSEALHSESAVSTVRIDTTTIGIVSCAEGERLAPAV